MNIVAIVQARILSSRLPGKVMLDANGKPILIRMIERLKKSKLCSKIVVATSTNKIDEIIVETCKKNNIYFYRGSHNDLLDRHINCAKQFEADIILKIPSDCPLIDFKIVDKSIEIFLEKKADYVSNIHKHNYPDGQDVEVISFDALSEANLKAKKEYEREHTSPYIWSKPSKFRIYDLDSAFPKKTFDRYRLTLDYIEDYWLILKILLHF